MAEIINLNRVRKAKKRNEAESTAEENRLRFGRSKIERDKARAEAERAGRDLDGKRLQDD